MVTSATSIDGDELGDIGGMPDLKSELTGTVDRPLQFSIVTPPGWARFRVDETAERQLAENMEQVFRDRGQPQELLRYRTQMHKVFSEL